MCRICNIFGAFILKNEVINSVIYVCELCGYEYDESLGDPDNDIAPETAWEDLPEDFVCPLCGVPKDQFVEKE